MLCIYHAVSNGAGNKWLSDVYKSHPKLTEFSFYIDAQLHTFICFQ